MVQPVWWALKKKHEHLNHITRRWRNEEKRRTSCSCTFSAYKFKPVIQSSIKLKELSILSRKRSKICRSSQNQHQKSTRKQNKTYLVVLGLRSWCEYNYRLTTKVCASYMRLTAIVSKYIQEIKVERIEKMHILMKTIASKIPAALMKQKIGLEPSPRAVLLSAPIFQL